MHQLTPPWFSVATIHDCGFELAPPPYLPDLAPSDFHLFPQMKKASAGCHFASDDVLIAVEEFFESQAKELFYAGIKALQQRGSKCSALEGDYVEK